MSQESDVFFVYGTRPDQFQQPGCELKSVLSK
jgi:hypothetical protein